MAEESIKIALHIGETAKRRRIPHDHDDIVTRREEMAVRAIILSNQALGTIAPNRLARLPAERQTDPGPCAATAVHEHREIRRAKPFAAPADAQKVAPVEQTRCLGKPLPRRLRVHRGVISPAPWS